MHNKIGQILVIFGFSAALGINALAEHPNDCTRQCDRNFKVAYQQDCKSVFDDSKKDMNARKALERCQEETWQSYLACNKNCS